jgi:hypothetical protein
MCDAHHSHALRAKVKSAWSSTFTSQYAFMALPKPWRENVEEDNFKNRKTVDKET